MSLRSPLGVVLGTGSAKEGTGHWWGAAGDLGRARALTSWFLYSLLALPALDYGTVRTWLAAPTTAFWRAWRWPCRYIIPTWVRR